MCFFICPEQINLFLGVGFMGDGKVLFGFVYEFLKDASFDFGTIIASVLVAIFLFLFAYFFAAVTAFLVLFGFFRAILLKGLRDASIRAVKHLDIFNEKVSFFVFLYDGARVESIGVDGCGKHRIDVYGMCQLIIDLSIGYAVFLAPVQRLQQELESALFEFTFVFFEFCKVFGTVA